jgi:hypothetical protein
MNRILLVLAFLLAPLAHAQGNFQGFGITPRDAAGPFSEVIIFTNRSVTTSGAGSWTCNSGGALATLPAGVWLLYASVGHSPTTAANNWRYFLSTNNNNDSTGLLVTGGFGSDSTNNASSGNDPAFTIPTGLVNVTSGTQSIYPKAWTEDTTGVLNFGGFAVRIK